MTDRYARAVPTASMRVRSVRSTTFSTRTVAVGVAAATAPIGLRLLRGRDQGPAVLVCGEAKAAQGGNERELSEEAHSKSGNLASRYRARCPASPSGGTTASIRERDPPVERHTVHDAAQLRLAELGAVGQDFVLSVDAVVTKR